MHSYVVQTISEHKLKDSCHRTRIIAVYTNYIFWFSSTKYPHKPNIMSHAFVKFIAQQFVKTLFSFRTIWHTSTTEEVRPQSVNSIFQTSWESCFFFCDFINFSRNRNDQGQADGYRHIHIILVLINN